MKIGFDAGFFSSTCSSSLTSLAFGILFSDFHFFVPLLVLVVLFVVVDAKILAGFFVYFQFRLVPSIRPSTVKLSSSSHKERG